MSAAHLVCLLTGSTLSPMILQLRFSNSGCNPAMYPSSVVHTGVKSLGCENRTAQPSPIHSWKLMVPCVVSAVKFGASSLMRKDMLDLLLNNSTLGRENFPRLGAPIGEDAYANSCRANHGTCPLDHADAAANGKAVRQRLRVATWFAQRAAGECHSHRLHLSRCRAGRG